MTRTLFVVFLMSATAASAQSGPDPEIKLSECQLLTNRAMAVRDAQPVFDRLQALLAPKRPAAEPHPHGPH